MIHKIAETGSTNADLGLRIAGGEHLPEGDWLVADRQTAGRGRLGRVWNDGLGNFMGSTVVHVVPGDPSPASLALLTGLAVYEALSSTLPTDSGLMLKWPNDLLVRGAKIAGILLEMKAGVVVVGVGVNLASAPVVPERKVAALADFGGDLTRDAFAKTLTTAFAAELQRWRSLGLAPMLRRWQSAAHPQGTPLRVFPPGEDSLDGTFAGLADDGNLRLALADGSIRAIHAGDVLLART